MIIGETNAAKRRITVYLTDEDGEGIPGLTFDAGEVMVSLDGADYIACGGLSSGATGTMTTPANAAVGEYEYTATLAEAAALSKLKLKVEKAGVEVFMWVEFMEPNLEEAIDDIALAPIEIDAEDVAEAVANVIMDPDAPEGIQTLRENINVITASIATDATGYSAGIAEQRAHATLGDPDETRLVYSISGGRKRVTKADGST